jgi:hypothetical protein
MEGRCCRSRGLVGQKVRLPEPDRNADSADMDDETVVGLDFLGRVAHHASGDVLPTRFVLFALIGAVIPALEPRANRQVAPAFVEEDIHLREKRLVVLQIASITTRRSALEEIQPSMTAPAKPVRFTPQAPQVAVTGCERESDLPCYVGESSSTTIISHGRPSGAVFTRPNSTGTSRDSR